MSNIFKLMVIMIASIMVGCPATELGPECDEPITQMTEKPDAVDFDASDAQTEDVENAFTD